jgi:hypothetical protein
MCRGELSPEAHLPARSSRARGAASKAVLEQCKIFARGDPTLDPVQVRAVWRRSRHWAPASPAFSFVGLWLADHIAPGVYGRYAAHVCGGPGTMPSTCPARDEHTGRRSNSNGAVRMFCRQRPRVCVALGPTHLELVRRQASQCSHNSPSPGHKSERTGLLR